MARIAACAAFASGCDPGGITPEQLAKRLVNGVDYRQDTITRAQAYGDEMLEPLRRESQDFSNMDPEGALRVSKVLSANRSTATTQLLRELFGRRELMSRLIGSAGLASRGEALGIEGDSFVARIAAGRLNADETAAVSVGTGPMRGVSASEVLVLRQLAIEALGRPGNLPAVPTLVEVLQQDVGPVLHGAACRSLGTIGGAQATAAIHDAQRTPGFDAALECRNILAGRPIAQPS